MAEPELPLRRRARGRHPAAGAGRRPDPATGVPGRRGHRVPHHRNPALRRLPPARCRPRRAGLLRLDHLHQRQRRTLLRGTRRQLQGRSQILRWARVRHRPRHAQGDREARPGRGSDAGGIRSRESGGSLRRLRSGGQTDPAAAGGGGAGIWFPPSWPGAARRSMSSRPTARWSPGTCPRGPARCFSEGIPRIGSPSPVRPR